MSAAEGADREARRAAVQAEDCVPVYAKRRPSYRRGCKATTPSERREPQRDATSVSCKTVTCKWLTTCSAMGRPATAATSALSSSPPLGLPPPPPEALRCCCLFRCCWPRPPRLGGTWRRLGGLSDGRPAGTAAAHYPATATRQAPPERLRRGRQPGDENSAAFGASINPGLSGCGEGCPHHEEKRRGESTRPSQ